MFGNITILSENDPGVVVCINKVAGMRDEVVQK
jgi:hypothetical protein